jgi:hypothetical protein
MDGEYLPVGATANDAAFPAGLMELLPLLERSIKGGPGHGTTKAAGAGRGIQGLARGEAPLVEVGEVDSPTMPSCTGQ